MKQNNMIKIALHLSLLALAVFALTGCQNETADEGISARAVYELDRVVIDDTTIIHHGHGTPFDHGTLTFVGEEQGGNVIFSFGGQNFTASINPSREHPSYADGYWHHHLYATTTTTGSPRINFKEAFPQFNIDENPEATDNTQSSYQHGNLHYVVETGEFRLRFLIDGEVVDLFFDESH